MSFPPGTTKRIFLCLASAALVILSFPNYLELTLLPKTAFLGWIALVPFFWALEGVPVRQGAFLGWVFGFAQFGGILYWVGQIEAAKGLSWLGWFALVLYLSLYPLVFGFLFSLLKRVSLGPWVPPVLWVGLEYLRGTHPWGGFSWGELGYSQAPYPSILTFTAWFGVHGLTFLMVWFNAMAAEGLSAVLQGREGRWSRSLMPFFVLGMVWVYGSLEIDRSAFEKKGTVAMLQASIPQAEKWSKANETATLQRFGKLVKGLGDPVPDLVLWPETAAPDFLSWSPDALRRVERIIKGSRTYHLVGCLDVARGARDPKTLSYNAAMAFDPDGRPSGAYHKRHLVPFGEFVPFQKYIRFLGPVIGDLGNFDRGARYELFRAKGFTYTPLICYEVIFPEDVSAAIRTGADSLVNISNDAWYGRTASAYQHAAMAVVRSAEQHKPLLRCSNAGICLATDPFGKVLGSTRLDEVRTFISDVLVLKGAGTFYSRHGDWLPWTCLVVTAFLLVLGRVRAVGDGEE